MEPFIASSSCTKSAQSFLDYTPIVRATDSNVLVELVLKHYDKRSGIKSYSVEGEVVPWVLSRDSRARNREF